MIDDPEAPAGPEPAAPGVVARIERAAVRAEEAAVRAEEAADDAAEVLEAGEVDVHGEFGRPGPPFEKRSPFYLGFVGALGALTAYFLFRSLTGIGSVLLLVVVALFLAAGLNPAVMALERRGLRRSWACAMVILTALVVVALFVVAIVPVITDQVGRITQNAPGWLADLQRNERVQQLDEEYRVVDKIEAYIADGAFVSGLFGGAIGLGLAVLSALFNAFIVLVLTLYFLSSLETTKSALYRLAPASRRDRVTRIGDRIVRNIGGYVSGAFLVALCAGVTSLIFLLAVGLSEYAVALAFVVALLDVIPMIGATLGAVVVTAIGFATDVQVGIACVVFYVLYQQVENYVLYPRVMRRSIDLPGSVTVIAALLGAALLGVVGALLAIPTAAAVLLVTREVVVRRQDAR